MGHLKDLTLEMARAVVSKAEEVRVEEVMMSFIFDCLLFIIFLNVNTTFSIKSVFKLFKGGILTFFFFH